MATRDEHTPIPRGIYALKGFMVVVFGFFGWLMATVRWSELGPHVPLVLRILLGGTFLLSSLPKLRDREAFVEIVDDYRLTPRPVSRLVGHVLPFVELLTALALLTGIALSWTASIAAVLFALFAVAVAVNLLRGHTQISCGCFGAELDEHLHWWMVGRNALLLAAAVSLADLGPGTWTLTSMGLLASPASPPANPGFGDLVLAVTVGAALLMALRLADVGFSLSSPGHSAATREPSA